MGQNTTYIVHPHLANTSTERDLDYLVEEAKGLAAAINLKVLQAKTVNLSRIQAGSFLTKGHRETIGQEIEELEPEIVIVNHALSPVQQRNLEREWGAKVIDRTGLILEIFGARAQTKEGRLQVELAALDYQRSRLVRSWTHLERQRGGAGFMGGPGETQIEIDRRLIGDRITRLKKQLEDVRRTRNLGKKSRENVPLPVIALVGYTNAGKSTLFNTLTGAKVMAKDLLFATLDPTMRRLELPGKQKAILSDTVGFISQLPTHLIESFKATLEQIDQADVIIHVRDVDDPHYDMHKQDVMTILKDLGIDYESDPRILEAWNKCDLLNEDNLQDFRRKENFQENAVLTSATNGQGIPRLLEMVVEILGRSKITQTFHLNPANGKAIAWLYEHGEVLERIDGEETIEIQVQISPANAGKFEEYF